MRGAVKFATVFSAPNVKMPEDRKNDPERVEHTLLRQLEEAKEALLQAVSALDEARESPTELEPARTACHAAYQRYHEALDRFSTWVLGPKRKKR